METLDWVTCKCEIKTVLEGGICSSNLECWFLRSKENREKQAVEKSYILEVRINLRETGMRRALSLSIPVNVQSEMLNEANARYSPK